MQNTGNIWLIVTPFVLATTILISVYGYYIYRSIRNYNLKSLALKQKFEDLKNKQEKLILETELEIQEQTFQFISKEIHDNVSQCLSLAHLTLNCIDLTDRTAAKKDLTKSIEQISKALNDLNNLSKSLDSDIIESYGLVAAIVFEVEKWERIFENKIQIKVEGSAAHLGSMKELFVFRIIQESLNNIIKYAKAKNINLNICYEIDTFKINISDDGVGFDLSSIYDNKTLGKMAGLKNMKQRAETLNGSLQIETNPQKGTVINVEIPITEKEDYDKSSTGRRPQVIA
jgi:signal transduction histidine kinase